MSTTFDNDADTRPAQLLVWTDIADEDEADFNRWYDREHMAERIGIPGFTLARRFRSTDGDRPYLALYQTTSLDTFYSDAYRQVFSNQTDWSYRTFARMVNTVRRVGAIEARYGKGEGGFLGLFTLPSRQLEPSGVALEIAIRLDHAVTRDGVVSGAVMRSEPSLSTALSGSTTTLPESESVVWLEGTDHDSVAAQIAWVANALDRTPGETATFSLLWSLRG